MPQSRGDEATFVSTFGDVFESARMIPDQLDDMPHWSRQLPLGDHDWSPSDRSAFRLRARIDYDSIGVSQSAANRATFGDLSDTFGLRRARIGAEGNVSPDMRYIAEIDLASGKAVVRDVFVGLGQVQDAGEFRVGHMREPFSLEGNTSANTFAFMERSPINNLDPARNWGAGYFRCSPDENSTIALGLFHSGTGPSDLQPSDGSDTAATARWTMLPWYEEGGERLLHVGLAVSSRIPDRGLVVINERPSSPLLDLGDSASSPFGPTIRIPANFQQLFNAQCAMTNGSFWAQAEWYGSLIDQRGGHPVFFHGCHVDAGYFLTGERRNYLTRNGVFGPVTVKRPLLSGFSSQQQSEEFGRGAWELTARFSYLDFIDANTPAGPLGQTVGIVLPQATVGVNWYLADRVRIMFNYSYSAPNEPNTGVSSASLFATRFAMFW